MAHDLVIVANRLPVDRVTGPDGKATWRRSPGGLVSAIEPVMRAHAGVWIGWPGGTEQRLRPFTIDGLALVPLAPDEHPGRRPQVLRRPAVGAAVPRRGDDQAEVG